VLKKTGVRLELLTDVDVHLFIDQGTRGGISMVSKRFAKANNPYVKDYNPNKPNNCISYLDANNLYCCAMCKPLPKGNFAWNTVWPNGKANPRQKGRSIARIASLGGFGVTDGASQNSQWISTCSREKKSKENGCLITRKHGG